MDLGLVIGRAALVWSEEEVGRLILQEKGFGWEEIMVSFVTGKLNINLQ